MLISERKRRGRFKFFASKEAYPIFRQLQGVQECPIPCFRKILKISNQQ